MSNTHRSDAPRYATLRDYVLVIRRYRAMIALIVLACGVAAYVVTSREKVTYQAAASVYFQDTSQELNLLGGNPVIPSVPEATLAQISAQGVTESPVVSRARSLLRLSSNAPLGGSLSTSISTQTYIVQIQATAGRATRAAQLANAFAEAARLVGRSAARAQYKNVAQTVKREFAPLIRQADPATRAAYRDRIATLQVLASSADPVKIVQDAAVPTTPSGPRTPRNTILGLIVGLTLALLVAFARDVLDRRLRAPADISEELGWPVIGHIRNDVFKRSPFLAATGKPMGEERDREAFRMLRENIRLLQMDNPPRSIAITSALPEEGKSTVAVCLALASATAGVRTLLVECDLRRPSLAARYPLEQSPGLAEYLLGEAAPEDILQIIEVPSRGALSALNGDGPKGGGRHASGTRMPHRLACITAGSSVAETAALLGSARFRGFLAEVTQAYEQVILDSGPILSVSDSTVLLTEAEAALVCVRAGRTTSDVATALRVAVGRLPERPVGVVVTGVNAGAMRDLGYYPYPLEAKA